VIEIRAGSETIPPGGTVQIKFGLTNPAPIMGGGGNFADSLMISDFFGISVFSPAGDAYGVAGQARGSLNISVFSPLASLGTSDYPFLTIAGQVAATAIPGTSMPLVMSGSFFDPTGAPIAYSVKPGTLTVGGSLSVNNIVPGGGTWPAGTVIRILGTGFSRSTALNRATFRVSSWQAISPTEIDLILAEQASLDHQFVILSNPDKSTVTYYMYIRGVESVKSSFPVVASGTPLFPGQSNLRVQTQQNSSGINGTVLTALAIQNSNTTPVIVKLEASTPATGRIAETTVTLEFGEKITRELGEFFGLKLAPGTTVQATSTSPVQFVGFTADTSTGALAPFALSAF
jgi:hypothetical protein